MTPLHAQPSPEARPRLAGAAMLRDYLPHSRAARAGVRQFAFSLHASRIGAREHEFGEGRAPAGGAAAEDARVGAAALRAASSEVGSGNLVLQDHWADRSGLGTGCVQRIFCGGSCSCKRARDEEHDA